MADGNASDLGMLDENGDDNYEASCIYHCARCYKRARKRNRRCRRCCARCSPVLLMCIGAAGLVAVFIIVLAAVAAVYGIRSSIVTTLLVWFSLGALAIAACGALVSILVCACRRARE